MEAKEFSEKYVGREVNVLDRNKHPFYSSLKMRVVGGTFYRGDEVLVSYFSNGTAYCESIYFPITDLYVLDNTIPDDCLECGAIGDQPCKSGCRNKEL